MVHHIVTTGPSIYNKVHGLDSEKLKAAKAEFKQLERDAIVQCLTPLGPALFIWSSKLIAVGSHVAIFADSTL